MLLLSPQQPTGAIAPRYRPTWRVFATSPDPETPHGKAGSHHTTARNHGRAACIRGIRVTVGMIVGQIGAGRSVDELLADYPYLEREDILQALRYAAWRAEEREVVLADA
jgi:uncharacterized protein (DUF433 family)